AKVELTAEVAAPQPGQPPVRFIQSQEICAGGRYLSSDEPMRVFAGNVTAALQKGWSLDYPHSPPFSGTIRFRLQVHWRSGRETAVEDVAPNYLYEIAEDSSPTKISQPPRQNAAPALFEDFSARLNHVHHDDPFDDFARQPLLPRKLSQGGPGIS